jgi:hypothetical protein
VDRSKLVALIQPVILGKLHLPFTRTFSGAGVPWPFYGSNLSMIGGKLAITPTLGAEMWDPDAAAFTSGTYAWVAQGGNTIANVGNALVVTYVDNTTGAKELLSDAADLSADLTVGQWYRFSVKQSINTSYARLRIYAPTLFRLINVFTVTPTVRVAEFLAQNATICYLIFQDMGAGKVATLDDLSLKPMTLYTMLAGGLPASRSNMIVKAGWTFGTGITHGPIIGVAACLDSYANPQNGLFGFHDGYFATLNKLVNGIWTNLINAAATYVAGAKVGIPKSGSAVGLLYNEVQIGATQAVTDPSVINNRLHAPFAGDSDSRCDSFSVTVN